MMEQKGGMKGIRKEHVFEKDEIHTSLDYTFLYVAILLELLVAFLVMKSLDEVRFLVDYRGYDICSRKSTYS